MSSRGHGGSVQQYYCHQCERTVFLSPSPSSEIACPICGGGFLEEIETPAPEANPSPFVPLAETFPPMFHHPRMFPTPSSTRSTSVESAVNIEELLGAISGFAPQRSSYTIALGGDVDPLNRTFQFFQSRLQDLIAGGANIQVVVENHPSGDFHFTGGSPMVVGDYVFGAGLEQLIQQLAENDPNRYGTPPASKSAIEAIPVIKITEELLATDEAQCAVCKDTFEIGEDAMQIPCKHIYHKDCILPWLELHNSCPVCRYELPTDDPDYEQRSRNAQAPQERSVGGTESGRTDSLLGTPRAGESPGARTGERTMRISLPWTIGSLLGMMDNSGNSGESSSNANTNSSARRGGRGSGENPRPEDLD